MTRQRANFLPDGVEELLPEAAWAAETLRRRLLDCYREHGYGLILPPLVEHLDSLLVGAGQDLEEQTFRFVDPSSGRMLGLRSDMTPQAARIAATRFSHDETVRLCYTGSVLRTHPDTPGGARAPRQAGCEFFGDASLAADLEVLELMVQTLQLAGVRQPLLDLGHMGVYGDLIAEVELSSADEQTLFDILQRKCEPELADWLRATALPEATRDALQCLIQLHGPPESVLPAAREQLPQRPVIVAALEALQAVVEALQGGEVSLHIDLSELRGYRYQTGLSFAAFGAERARELARGGRYDGIGDVFGAPRPATGFSADINELLAFG